MGSQREKVKDSTNDRRHGRKCGKGRTNEKEERVTERKAVTGMMPGEQMDRVVSLQGGTKAA